MAIKIPEHVPLTFADVDERSIERLSLTLVG